MRSSIAGAAILAQKRAKPARIIAYHHHPSPIITQSLNQ
jgi:hypothetical protein